MVMLSCLRCCSSIRFVDSQSHVLFASRFHSEQLVHVRRCLKIHSLVRTTAPPGGLSIAEGEAITVTYEDEKPASSVTYTVLAPLPRFVAPTPEHGTRFETATDCDVQVTCFLPDLWVACGDSCVSRSIVSIRGHRVPRACVVSFKRSCGA
jgi:hypothetical protein